MASERPTLRLVWSNPDPPARPAPRRVDLALAIERHLAGRDGLSKEQFLLVYSGRCRSRLSPVPVSDPY
jgi:hypothetical protein